MTNSQQIRIDRIGSVIFEPSRRAKRIVISISPFKGVRVAVPTGTSFQKALAFVHVKKQWIIKQLDRIRQIENQTKDLANSSAFIDQADMKKRLTERLNHLAEKHGFVYRKISIRNQRTRWGSCSHKNNISLNVKLGVLPEELVDYA